jgi:proline iminopeptidase
MLKAGFFWHRSYMSLYPEIEPSRQFHLPVGDGHELYVEEAGNPAGTPVLVVHGGPGGACSPRMRRYFDPDKWRIILFDQRGAGCSRPSAGVEHNTTEDLIADMERIRTRLDVDRWVVFGGSWGATLALLYAQSRPEQTLGLILRGAFLCRQRDIGWLFTEGASRIYPDAWQRLIEPIPPSERDDLIGAYYQRLIAEPVDNAQDLAARWTGWEGACSTLKPNQSLVSGYQANAMVMARLECHYFQHDGFIRENRILEDMHRIRHLPGILVHGRYDMVCPMEQSWLLHQVWPASRLELVDEAGHSATEPSVQGALVAAAANLLEQLEAA